MKASLPSKKQRQFVISIGDDGAILVYLEGRRVLKRMFASSPAKEDTRHFDSVLKSDKQASISLLIDVMDQSYLQQTLPPVSSLSVNKLIKRRLERDFAEDDIKGALPLGRAKEGRRDWNYLFIAIPNTPPLSDWIDFISDRPHRFAGLFLLPVESENLVKALYSSNVRKLPSLKKKGKGAAKAAINAGGDKDTPGKWHIMVSHQKVGGFRQIVMKDGRLIFTRMAQPIGEPMPEVIAGNIEQELANTTEYLKRLSFNPADGLDITIIVAKEIKNALNISNPNVRKVTALTPHEVAERLGLQKATEEGDHFGDVVFAGCFGMVPTPRLRLFTRYTQKLHKFHQARRAINIAASVLMPLLVLGAAYTAYGIYGLQQDIAFAEEKYVDVRTQLDSIKGTAKALPHDINRIADVVQLYETLSEGDISPLSTVSTFAQSLDESTLVRRFEWESISDINTSRRPETLNDMEVRFDIEFLDSVRTVDALITRTDTFRTSLQTLFPEFNVSYSQLPGTVKDDELFEIDFDSETKRDPFLANEEINVVVTIAKPPTDDKRRRKLRRSQ